MGRDSKSLQKLLGLGFLANFEDVSLGSKYYVIFMSIIKKNPIFYVLGIRPDSSGSCQKGSESLVNAWDVCKLG